MGYRLGSEGKLYFCEAGIGGMPVWTLLSNVKDVTLDLKKGEADVTTRGNDGWRATVGTLKELIIEFEMVWDNQDDGFAAIRDAWLDGTLLGIAAMSGDIVTPGSEGPWVDMSVVGFSRQEPLEEAMTAKVTLKAGYSANAPQWKEIGVSS